MAEPPISNYLKTSPDMIISNGSATKEGYLRNLKNREQFNKMNVMNSGYEI